MKLFSDYRVVLSFYVLIAVVGSVHKYRLGDKLFDGQAYTHYNNFVIFRDSSTHLLEHQDLYELHLDDHWDYFLYSPSFAFCAIPFRHLPDLAGLIVWNVVNAIALFFALRCLPIGPAATVLVQWLVLKELMTTLQNSQSNGLVAALVVLVFVGLERGKPAMAAFCLAASFFVKIFGIVAALLLVFYPHKRKFAGFAFLWFVALAAAPMLVIPPAELLWQYQNWLGRLQADHTVSYGMSVMGWLHSWFGLSGHQSITVLAGGGLLLLPLLRVKDYENPKFRVWYLAAVMIWIVIFNHKAESPSFVIAMCGVSLWYATSDRSRLDTALMIFAFIFTSLSTTDLIPRPLRDLVTPYQLKALPCMIVWLKLILDLSLGRLSGNAAIADVSALPSPVASSAA